MEHPAAALQASPPTPLPEGGGGEIGGAARLSARFRSGAGGMTRRLALAAALIAAAGPALAGEPGSGGVLYDRYCASCHGFDGFPNLPGTPDFSRGESLLKSDPELIAAIRFGVLAMPGFDQIIDREGMIDVVFYIRTLQR